MSTFYVGMVAGAIAVVVAIGLILFAVDYYLGRAAREYSTHMSCDRIRIEGLPPSLPADEYAVQELTSLDDEGFRISLDSSALEEAIDHWKRVVASAGPVFREYSLEELRRREKRQAEGSAETIESVDDTQRMQEVLDAAAARGEKATFSSGAVISAPLVVKGPGLVFDTPPTIELDVRPGLSYERVMPARDEVTKKDEPWPGVSWSQFERDREDYRRSVGELHYQVNERVFIKQLDVCARITHTWHATGGMVYQVRCEHPLPGFVWSGTASQLRIARSGE